MVNENNPIPPELEKQIQNYENHLLKANQTWDRNNLEKEVSKYLDWCNGNGTRTDKLHSRFARIWACFYDAGKYFEADKFWDLPLDLYEKWEKINNQTVVKGTPHYFRGMSAIQYGNIYRGFLFFHRALEDDFKDKFRPYKTFKSGNWSPAWTFVTFNYRSRRQAARPLLTYRAKWLNKKISNYKNSNRGSLSLGILRRKVLTKRRLLENTFSFTYEVFRSENLLSYRKEFRASRFASQLSLDILFSLCRIGEVWLKTKLRTKKQEQPTLYPLLVRFFEKRNIPITEVELKAVGKIDFEKSISSLLDNKKGPLPRRFQFVESDLLLIYVLRNEASHSPTSSLIISERFDELLERVLFGLFKIVEVLY
jgi:hypothetical protein